MTGRSHRRRHKELHQALDELVADFIGATGSLPSKTSVLLLMHWSHGQAKGAVAVRSQAGGGGGSKTISGSNQPVACATP